MLILRSLYLIGVVLGDQNTQLSEIIDFTVEESMLVEYSAEGHTVVKVGLELRSLQLLENPTYHLSHCHHIVTDARGDFFCARSKGV